jgi:hypothetical protein
MVNYCLFLQFFCISFFYENLAILRKNLESVCFKNCPLIPSFILVQINYSTIIYEFGGKFSILMVMYFQHDPYDVII